MNSNVCHIRFPTHNIHLSMEDESGIVHCFKYTDSRCDLESFTDLDELADWLMLPLPKLVYQVNINDD